MFIVRTIFTTNHCTDKPHIFTYFYPNEAQRNAVWIYSLPSCKILLFYTLLSDKRSNKLAALANSVFIASHTCYCMHAQWRPTLQPCSLQPNRFLCPWNFPRQGDWNYLPFATPGDLPNPGIQPASPASPALTNGFFTTVPTGKPVVQTENT